MVALGREVARSPRVRSLLGRRGILGRPGTSRGVYNYWQGCQWVLEHLADLGYPPGDRELEPMRDRVLDLWLRPSYYRELRGAVRPRAVGVPLLRGRYRRCASQQGNALLALTALGLDDGRCADLAERLVHWQWPDGGWNCDRDPSADTSSFLETLLPMRGLALYGRLAGRSASRAAARRASEVFLSRRLYRRRSDGAVIRPTFARLHYPLYYHYDVLGGLRGMVDVGRIGDRRCHEALDLLESKRRADGGWPAEEKFYRYTPGRYTAGGESVDWGGVGARRANPWVTADALGVLRAAGRLEL